MFAKWVEDDQRFAFAFENNDGIEVADDRYQQLIELQSLGQPIVRLPDGSPDNQPSPLHSYMKGKWVIDEAKQAAAAKSDMDASVMTAVADAGRQIAVLQDAVDLGLATDAETTAHSEWRKYRMLLWQLASNPKYPNVELPQQPLKVIQ